MLKSGLHFGSLDKTEFTVPGWYSTFSTADAAECVIYSYIMGEFTALPWDREVLECTSCQIPSRFWLTDTNSMGEGGHPMLEGRESKLFQKGKPMP